MTKKQTLFLSFWLLVGLAGSPTAWAVDGVLEINQACAVNTGCFAGDTAGFPVTIDGSAATSYRLTGDLSVAAASTDAIEVSIGSTLGVTIDLNGFTVAGPVTCTGTGSAVSCMPAGSGRGVDAAAKARMTVRDGRVLGFADAGVIAGERAQIRNVVAESNGGSGILAGQRSIVSESIAFRNGSVGIFASTASVVERSVSSSNGTDGINAGGGSSVVGNATWDNGARGIFTGGAVVRNSSAFQNELEGIRVGTGSLVSDCVAQSNDGDGIFAASDSLVQRNMVRGNGGIGARLASDAAYRENVINDNTGGTVPFGVNMGDNSCNGTATCP